MSEREVRIYTYTFSNGASLEIEAPNRAQARKFLVDFITAHIKDFIGTRLDDEKVTNPCIDVSTKKKDGKKYIWVGFETSPDDGWMEYGYYKFLRSIVHIEGKKIR